MKATFRGCFLIEFLSNNIAVDPAVPVILSKAKYLCSAWL